jgi:hypothetical protein
VKEEVDNVKGKLVGIMHGMGADGAGGRKTWGTTGSIHLKETEGKNEALSAQVRPAPPHVWGVLC